VFLNLPKYRNVNHKVEGNRAFLNSRRKWNDLFCKQDLSSIEREETSYGYGNITNEGRLYLSVCRAPLRAVIYLSRSLPHIQGTVLLFDGNKTKSAATHSVYRTFCEV
jgi:hypothetical protein